MAYRTEQSREIPTTTLPADVESSAESPESLEKVRDILIGAQVREIEGRIRNLEQRLREEQESTRARLERRMSELESIVRREMQLFDERIAGERRRRGEEFQLLADEVRESIGSLTSLRDRFEENSNRASDELREEMLQHSADMATRIALLTEWLSSEMQRQFEELRATSIDSASMSNLFSEMAARLGATASAAEENGTRE